MDIFTLNKDEQMDILQKFALYKTDKLALSCFFYTYFLPLLLKSMIMMYAFVYS